MRLAVFTNQFPSRLAPFFARDMRALLEAQVDLDVFPLYPLDPEEWAGSCHAIGCTTSRSVPASVRPAGRA